MATSEQESPHKISRVLRGKEEARRIYNRISLVYDWFDGILECKFAEKTLRYSKVINSERVLENGLLAS